MDARELMIGDWVYGIDGKGGKHPCRINTIDIYPQNRTPRVVTSGGYGYQQENLEPIPITPEILEKNGFAQNAKSKSRRSYQICNSDVYISWWRGRLNILYKPFVGHSTNHLNADGKYVHDLQHALRMCGIEKEIVL